MQKTNKNTPVKKNSNPASANENAKATVTKKDNKQAKGEDEGADDGSLLSKEDVNRKK